MDQERTISPIREVAVRRNGKGLVEIRWEPRLAVRAVSIFYGASPDGLDQAWTTEEVAPERAEIGGLDSDRRYYFKVCPEGAPGVMAAERRVRVEGSVNFRDLGGYESADGGRVKWGRVFRSDNLARLTGKGEDFLSNMGIRVVCDLRTEAEVKMAPDRLPRDGLTTYVRLPVTQGGVDSVTAFDLIKKGDISWFTDDFMVNGYLQNIDESALVWGEVIKLLAEPANRPLLFHCTGGKDRAGLCAALVLLALGVSEETVIHDHGLSNLFISEVVEMLNQLVKGLGFDPERLAPYFTASKDCIVAALQHIRKKYGSAEAYLIDRGGVEEKTLVLLRDQLLE